MYYYLALVQQISPSILQVCFFRGFPARNRNVQYHQKDNDSSVYLYCSLNRKH